MVFLQWLRNHQKHLKGTETEYSNIAIMHADPQVTQMENQRKPKTQDSSSAR